MDEAKGMIDETLLRDLSAQPLLAAYVEINHLKQLYRQGWLQAGIPREQCETVAEHCFGMALLAWLLVEGGLAPGVDRDRALRMILAHELGEIYTGDVIPAEGMPKEEKHRREWAALERICARLPQEMDFLTLWEEFEQGASPEARLARQLDRLEMALQALIYERAGLAQGAAMDGLYASAGEMLRDSPWAEMFATLCSLRPGGEAAKSDEAG
jgi:putative hydrolase of HD superfamily